MRCRGIVLGVLGGGLLASLMVAPACGADRPIVEVSVSGLAPARIEVHAGEVIAWRPIGGVRLRLAFDPHRDAHEVVEGSKEMRAVFRRPGEHWYAMTILSNGHHHARGVVVVRGPEGDPSWPSVCAPGSSPRICFEP